MQNFLEIAKTDFTDTFSGAWIFPMLLIGILWILWQEKDCVLAYDWAVMPFYAEILLEPGTLTDAQREELAASFVLATDN